MGVFVNLKGRKVGNLVVLDEDATRADREIFWLAKCICDKVHSYRGYRLRHELVIECPDCAYKRNTERFREMAKASLIDLTGQIFTDLTVLKRDPRSQYPDADLLVNNRRSISRVVRWLCQCKCGRIVSVNGAPLRYGEIRRCITCRNLRARKTAAGVISTTHWDRIRKNASVRGIDVAITAEEAYQKYLDQNGVCALSGLPIGFYDEKTRPRHTIDTASLDRIDSSKGYITGNIQWVHKEINIMKNIFDDKEFIEFAILVAEHSTNRKHR